MKKQFRSAVINIIVTDDAIGKDQLIDRKECESSYVSKFLTDMLNKAGLAYPHGIVKYELLAKAYKPMRKRVFVGQLHFVKISLDDLSI